MCMHMNIEGKSNLALDVIVFCMYLLQCLLDIAFQNVVEKYGKYYQTYLKQ